MDKTSKAVFDANAQCCDIMNHFIKEETMEEPTINLSPMQMDGAQVIIPIPKGYEFAGVDDDNQQVIFEKIGYHYPKTYEECCKVLNICPNGDIVYSGNWVYGGEYLEKHLERIRIFQKLLICRDAYWKIAGEQMGLGKPWEPKKAETVYAIVYDFYDEVIDVSVFDLFDNIILVFPTVEMQDAFYENFKDLIKQCKELL